MTNAQIPKRNRPATTLFPLSGGLPRAQHHQSGREAHRLPQSEPLLDDLIERIRQLGPRVLVAFSGGVDSTVVAKLATLALGRDNTLCIAARSESNTDEDMDLCRTIARDHDLAFEIIEYSELAIPNYATNPANRCYFCKSELYDRLSQVAADRAFSAILDGSNADDAGDYRPGMKAVAERNVRSPLREAGIRKEQVRQLARQLGLPNHDKPGSPCLSSRVPYGSEITREKLEQIAHAERYLRGIGLREFRCRHHGDIARIEADPAQFQLLLDNRQRIVTQFRSLGFKWVSIDLAGFKSGSLNDLLPSELLPGNHNSRPSP